MSKKKRVRRDVEKFYRSGRYWELLRLLESTDGVSAHAREHREAWQAVTRQAVKQASAFERFCGEVDSFHKHPGDPDFRLLMLLKDFVETRNSAQQILQAKGLSAGGEKLRSNFASFTSGSVQQDGKLKDLLGKFIQEPGKITRRYYEQLAEILRGNPWSVNVSRLGQSIPFARRLNQKAALSRGWNGFSMDALKSLDQRMFIFTKDLPPALRDIVLHPFIHNLAILCRRLAPETGSQQGTRFVHSIPFCFPRLAAERSEEIRGKLLPDLGEWGEGTDLDASTLQEDLKGLGLEAKVALLARLRAMGMRKPSHGERLDISESFDEEDEEEEMEREETGHLAKMVLMVHRSVLRDISLRAATLPPREKRELVRVMEPILCKDLSFVLSAMDGPEEFVRFLMTILDSGCAGVQTGLLGLLAGAYYRDRDLLKGAEKLLDQAPEPTRDEMKWLADEWVELYYPLARSLRPLLKRYADHTEFLIFFNKHLCMEVELELVEFAAKTRTVGFFSSFIEGFRPEKLANPGILRRELAELSEYDALNLARLFLSCYPQDRLTPEGHLQWFSSLYAFRQEGFWNYVLEDLRRYDEVREFSRSLLPVGIFRSIQDEKVEAVLLFLKEHSDALPAAPMESLAPLLDELLKHPQILTRQQRLLIHLNNQLAERLAAGEEATRPLVDKIKRILLSLARPAKNATKPRKKRR